MERFRLLWLESFEFFLLAKLARDFTERRLRALAVCIESRGRILFRGRAAIIFCGALVLARFDFSLIFRREDLLPFEIFFGVHVLRALLLFLFASAFLAGGIGDALVLLSGSFLPLRIDGRRTEKETSEKQRSKRGTTSRQDTARARAARLEGARAV